MQHLQIDIVSDVACPWCAIGYKRLERALSQLEGEIDASITWHAFRLNPDMPPEGEPILEHLMRKYGRSEADIEQTQAQIKAIADDLGLDFSQAATRRACDTFDAHRLLTWARERGCQTELKLALFEAYFGQARDMADPAVLQAVAESVGLPADETAAILASDRYGDEVRTEERHYQQAGVSAVPAFIINNHYLISGAQEPETLANAFREIAGEALADSE